MLKILFFLFLIPFIGFGNGLNPPFAPLMPLVPGDPLELNPHLRHELYQTDQSAHNLAIFNSYTIPWMAIGSLIILAMIAPFLLLILKGMIHEPIKPSFITLLEQIKALQESSLSPKERLFELAKLFKIGFGKGVAMTYQELLDSLQNSRRYSGKELSQIKDHLNALEKLQFQLENPSFENVTNALNKTEYFLNRHKNNE